MLEIMPKKENNILLNSTFKIQNFTFQTYSFTIWRLVFDLLLHPQSPQQHSKLNLPMNLPRLCAEIQCSKELSIMKVVADYLTKHNKHKKWNIKTKPEVKKFWIKNRDSLQENTNPLHLFTLLLELIPPQSRKILNQE